MEKHDRGRLPRGSTGYIKGVDILARKIRQADATGLISHLFHAHLTMRFHETRVFDVEEVEAEFRTEDGKKTVVDIKLCDRVKGRPEELFIEAWYGKSKFGHDKDKARAAGGGSAGAVMADDMGTMIHELEQMPPGRGFVLNYAIGTDHMTIPPIAESCPRDKCIITVRSNMQAYVYGKSDFPYIEDVLRICCLFGWRSNNMLGKPGPDKAAFSVTGMRLSARGSARKIG